MPLPKKGIRVLDVPDTEQAYKASLTLFSQAVLSGDSGYEAYTYNYLAGHAAALGNVYLSVKQILGEQIFDALSFVYAQHFPATRWDLNRYGAEFPGFLAAQANGPKADAFNWLALSVLAKAEFGVTEQYYAELDIHCGGEATVVSDEQSQEIEAEHISCLVQSHPYLEISGGIADGHISVSLPIAIWRDQLTIRLVSLSALGGEETETPS